MKSLIPWAVILALNSPMMARGEGQLATTAISTSNTSARSGKLGSGYYLVKCTAVTHYQTGGSAVVATTNDLTLPANTLQQVYLPNDGSKGNYIAFILDSSTGSCSIYLQNWDGRNVPPSHLAAAHSITDVGTATTNGMSIAQLSVTAGTTCLCTAWSDPADPVLDCSVADGLLTITTSTSGTRVGYLCST